MSTYRSSVYYRLPDGTAKYVSIRAKSKRELEQKKLALKEKEKQGIELSQNCTFGYWSNLWLTNTKLNQGLSMGTEDCYKSCVLMLNTEFEKVQFRYLTMNRFQEFINRLALCNPKTGKPMSASYLRKIRSTAKSIALYASGSHVDGVSAFYNVNIPRTAPTKKRDALSVDQVHMIESYPDEMQLFAMIATFSGLRRGEILALQWKHVDLEHSTIQVEQSLNWEPNQPVIKKGGKTVNSVRLVAIPPVLSSYLEQYRAELKVYPTPQSYVCSNTHGKLYTQSEFRRRWNHYMKELNKEFGDFSNCDLSSMPEDQIPIKIDPFTPHQCRHFFATLCYLEDLSIGDTMSELGHADPKTTMAIYTDLKNYRKADLPESFRNNLLTVYQIPIKGIVSKNAVSMV